MRTRFIHQDFELDVSHLELNWVEENTWFKDEFFLISSFPFEMPYDQVDYFQKFKHDNLATTDTILHGKLEKDGAIEDAILEIEEAGNGLLLTIRYGIEALPNWNKLISEIEMDVVLPEGGNMRTHANTIVTKTYPEVNYNFPAIHSDYYNDDPMFNGWGGTINKRVSGVFVHNIPDGHNTINRNIVYPLPYYLYVLKKVVEDAGFVLKGDILNDEDLKHKIIFSGKKIAEFEGIPAPANWIIGLESRTDVEFIGLGVYKETWLDESQLNHRGHFHFHGYVHNYVLWATIKLNDEVIYSYTPGQSTMINFWVTTDQLENDLTFEGVSISIGSGDNPMDVTITTLYLTDENGEMVPFVADFSNVQLASKLPDMTVGDFFKFPKRLKNYDLDIRNGNELWMNLISKEIEESKEINLEEFEVLEKRRRFEPDKSFILQYEGEYEDYHFAKIYSDKNGFIIDDFKKKEDTQEITINGIPLPIIDKDGIRTAVQITEGDDKMMLVDYRGLKENDNWTNATPELDTLNLYQKEWKFWLHYMIHAVLFSWTIKSKPNLLIPIKRKSKLFAFNNLMFVHTLNRRRTKDVEEIEIQAYSSKV